MFASLCERLEGERPVPDPSPPPDVLRSAMEDLDAATDEELRQALADAHLAVARADERRLAVVAAAEARGVPQRDGHRDVTGWVAATTGCSRLSTQRMASRARLVSAVPEFESALHTGVLGIDHLDVLGRAHDNPRCGHLLADFAAELTTAAGTLTFRQFELLVRHWVSLADQDGQLTAAERDHMRRTLSVHTRPDGTGVIRGQLGPAQMAVFAEVYTRFLDAERDLDWQQSHDADADPDTVTVAPRTAGQRAADALMAMVEHAAIATTDAKRPAPLVNLVVDEGTATELLASGRCDIEARPLSERICRTADGTPVALDDMLAALLVGGIQVIVVDAAKNPIAVGAPKSLFNRATRQAMRKLNIECVWPGCHIAGRHLDADHLHARCHGGPTSTDNCGSLCGHHNRWRHARGYRITKDAAGHWHIWRSDGTEVVRPLPSTQVV